MQSQTPPPPPAGSSLFQLNLDASNSYQLRSAAGWARVLGICGLIIGIVFLLIGIVAQVSLSSMRSGREIMEQDSKYSMLLTGGLLTYLIVGLVMIITSIFLLNFSSRVRLALRTNDQGALNAGFAGARNYFAFWAILMILFLLLMLLGILASMI